MLGEARNNFLAAQLERKRLRTQQQKESSRQQESQQAPASAGLQQQQQKKGSMQEEGGGEGTSSDRPESGPATGGNSGVGAATTGRKTGRKGTNTARRKSRDARMQLAQSRRPTAAEQLKEEARLKVKAAKALRERQEAIAALVAETHKKLDEASKAARRRRAIETMRALESRFLRAKSSLGITNEAELNRTSTQFLHICAEIDAGIANGSLWGNSSTSASPERNSSGAEGPMPGFTATALGAIDVRSGRSEKNAFDCGASYGAAPPAWAPPGRYPWPATRGSPPCRPPLIDPDLRLRRNAYLSTQTLDSEVLSLSPSPAPALSQPKPGAAGAALSSRDSDTGIAGEQSMDANGFARESPLPLRPELVHQLSSSEADNSASYDY